MYHFEDLGATYIFSMSYIPLTVTIFRYVYPNVIKFELHLFGRVS